MVFIPVSYSILVIISDLATTAKREGRADDGEDGPMARAEDGGGRPMQKADGKGRWQRPKTRRFDGVREKDYICVLALKRV